MIRGGEPEPDHPGVHRLLRDVRLLRRPHKLPGFRRPPPGGDRGDGPGPGEKGFCCGGEEDPGEDRGLESGETTSLQPPKSLQPIDPATLAPSGSSSSGWLPLKAACSWRTFSSSFTTFPRLRGRRVSGGRDVCDPGDDGARAGGDGRGGPRWMMREIRPIYKEDDSVLKSFMYEPVEEYL